MDLLLVAATAKELESFLNEYRNNKLLNTRYSIDILITGVGLTATAYALTKQFHLKKPDIVIQAGVAGCFDKKIPLGKVFVVKQDTIADESVVELKKLKTIFDLKLVPQNQFPFQNGWLKNPHLKFLRKSKLTPVRAISVNQITTEKKWIRFYKKEFHPVLESMEGAALHYVCLMEKIPFLQIRSVSNYIGERDKKKWDMKGSIFNLNKCLISIINDY